jgi:pyrroloquinoline quinone biosynthesis protein E
MNGWGTTFLGVAPDGVALPCHAARMLPGLDLPNVLNQPLREIWQSSAAFQRFRGTHWMPDPCQSCASREDDYGGCRCQAYLLTGDAARTDPVCGHSPDHAVVRATVLQGRTAALAARANPLNGGVTESPIVFRTDFNSRRLTQP